MIKSVWIDNFKSLANLNILDFIVVELGLIDEGIFSELYSHKKSRPNVAVNRMVGALILKHSSNWTYEELFKNLTFNILTRHAIGINTIEEDAFSEASLFNFLNKMSEHLLNEGEDLMKKVFEKLTANQIEIFEIKTHTTGH